MHIAMVLYELHLLIVQPHSIWDNIVVIIIKKIGDYYPNPDYLSM